MLTLDFIRAGKAIFTIELSPEFAATHKIPPHYTFKVSHQPAENGYRECWFVSLLTGPENTSDYTYVGLLADDNTLRLTQKSKFRPDSMPVRILSRILANLVADTADRITSAGFNLHHEGRCGRCGRLLTVPSSIESGIGPECAKRI